MSLKIDLSYISFLALILCGQATCFAASVDDLDYEIIGNSIRITDCDPGAQGELVIPSQIKGISVEKIDILAFEGVAGLTKINLPDTLTEIADAAFLDCIGLSNLSLPSSLVSIGENAFAGCDNIVSVYFEGSAPAVGVGPFTGVKASAYVTPSHVQSFGGNGMHWNGLTVAEILFTYEDDGSSITITDYPEDVGGVLTIPATMFGMPVTKIGPDAFRDCLALTKVLIPESVTQIETRAFQGCRHLTEVIIPDSVTNLGSGLFRSCVNLITVTLPANITEVPSGLFWECTSLAGVTIPKGVTEIGPSAFYRCTNLTRVIIPVSVVAVGNNAFGMCARLVTLSIPENVTTIGDQAFLNCTHLLGVEFSNQTFSLGSDTFAGCLNLRGLYFGGPAPVISAGTAGIELPTRIVVSEDHKDSFGGYGAIWNGLPVESGNEKSIYYQYLEYPSSITITDYWEEVEGELEIPDMIFLKPVTEIANRAFQDCAALTSIDIPEGVTTIGTEAFSDCSDLEALSIPEGVTEIASGAFRNCLNLVSLEIPESVETLGSGLIHGCLSLTQLTVHADNNNYQSINGVLLQDEGTQAIGFASGLSVATIPTGVTTIMPGAFYGSIHLTRVAIPEGVTFVYGQAFAGCSSLRSITIPESVMYFGNNVFQNATTLQSIIFDGTAPPLTAGDLGVAAVAMVNAVHAQSFGGEGALWNGLTVSVRSNQPSGGLLLELLSSPGDLLFNAQGLTEDNAYEIKSSYDLQNWSSIHQFTANGSSELVAIPRPEEERVFFRINEISGQ